MAYELFIGEIPQGKLVLHKCGTKKCVNPSHLYAGSHHDNMQDAIRMKENAFGERAGSSVLNQSQVIQIRELSRQGRSLKSLSRLFNCSIYAVRAVIYGRTWKHVGGWTRPPRRAA